MRFWQNNKVWCVRLWHFDTSINVKQSSKPSVHHDQTIPAHELCLSQTVRKKVVGALHQHRQAMVVLTWQRRKTTTAERWSRWHWHRPTRARPPPPPTCAPTTSTSSATASSHIETTLRWIPASAVQLSISHQAGDSGQMASCFLEWARRAPQHAFHVHWSRIRGDWTMPFFYRRRQPADRWRVFFELVRFIEHVMELGTIDAVGIPSRWLRAWNTKVPKIYRKPLLAMALNLFASCFPP